MNILLIQTFVVALGFFSYASPSFANEIKIIEIKRTLSLSNNKRHNKEFYINAGTQNGLKIKHIVPVVRRKSFHDPLLNQNIGDLWIPVGDLKLIHVGEKISIARIHQVPGRKELPEIEYATFMIGDRLQTKKARFLKKSKKRKSARVKKKAQRGIASVDPNASSIKKNKYSFSQQLRNEMKKPSSSKKDAGLMENFKASRGSAGRSLPMQSR